MTDLERHLDDYLRVRRALGFKLAFLGRVLPQFVSFLQAAGVSTVTVELQIAKACSGIAMLAVQMFTSSTYLPCSWRPGGCARSCARPRSRYKPWSGRSSSATRRKKYSIFDREKSSRGRPTSARLEREVSESQLKAASRAPTSTVPVLASHR